MPVLSTIRASLCSHEETSSHHTYGNTNRCRVLATDPQREITEFDVLNEHSMFNQPRLRHKEDDHFVTFKRLASLTGLLYGATILANTRVIKTKILNCVRPLQALSLTVATITISCAAGKMFADIALHAYKD